MNFSGKILKKILGKKILIDIITRKIPRGVLATRSRGELATRYVECTRIIKTTRAVAALEGPLIHVILHMLAQLCSDGTHTITVPAFVVLARF